MTVLQPHDHLNLDYPNSRAKVSTRSRYKNKNTWSHARCILFHSCRSQIMATRASSTIQGSKKKKKNTSEWVCQSREFLKYLFKRVQQWNFSYWNFLLIWFLELAKGVQIIKVGLYLHIRPIPDVVWFLVKLPSPLARCGWASFIL